MNNDGADKSEIDKKNAEKVDLEAKKKQLEDAGTLDYTKKTAREKLEAEKLKDIKDKLQASKDKIAAEEKLK